MNINIRNSFDPEFINSDISVVIDIFRASTTICYILNQVPKIVLGVNSLDNASKWINDGYQLVSEVYDGGFDNSPSQMLGANLDELSIVHKSSNLTNAVFSKKTTKSMLVCGFVNISEVYKKIIEFNANSVEIIMGGHFKWKEDAVEDLSCAKMLEKLLLDGVKGEMLFQDKIDDKVNNNKNEIGVKYSSLKHDLDLCLEVDRLKVVPSVNKFDKLTVEYSI